MLLLSREPPCKLLFMFIDVVCQLCIVVLFSFFLLFLGFCLFLQNFVMFSKALLKVLFFTLIKVFLLEKNNQYYPFFSHL